jgi:hypothetical protein
MKKALVAALVLTCLLTLTGCGNDSGTPQRFLSIEGDVGTYVSYKTEAPSKNDDALPGDKDFDGVSLPDFLASSEISGTPVSVWLISSGDGFAVKLAWDGLEDAYIAFSETNGWRCIAPKHPISANAMDIDRILVVSEGSEVGLPLTKPDGSTEVIPFGKILTSPLLTAFHFEGQADQGAGESQLSSEVYTRETTFSLADVYDGEASGFVVVTANGDKYLTDGQGRFAVFRQTLSYIESTGDEYENVVEVQLR